MARKSPAEDPMSVTAARRWKQHLAGSLPPELSDEIDVFETQIELRRTGKLDDKLFAETRLRRGVYGQRYDNGQRHDGFATRTLAFPSGDLEKGPGTKFDAPGMMRIKIPFGRLSPEQLEVLAELAEEYSDGILHVTTRQDIQLHFVHLDDTPTIMRRLAAFGITTREACGNTVRNVTACPLAGVCNGEGFDVTPYANALTYYLLGHPDTQNFGRKFKVAFSGCKQEACGLTSMHDLGFIATTRDGARGFEVYVGGGLGAVPHQAKLLSEFVPENEVLPLSQAVCRVFARLGEKKNRARARLKFLVAKLGIDELERLVAEERETIPASKRWTAYLDDLDSHSDRPLRDPAPLRRSARPTGDGGAFDAWFATNVYAQRQAGYSVATIRLPLGDATADQFRAIAAIARAYTGDTVRATVEQNLVLRWVADADLPALYRELDAVGLAADGAGTMQDITACPGTDTCKLGIAASRGLASELTHQIGKRKQELPDDVRGLRIKTSGCFNACGQHHIADIGFLGVSRNVKGRRVPHFQLVLGGEWKNNAGAYGLAIGAVPSKRVDDVLQRVTAHYVDNREDGESFQDFFKRTGRKATRALLEDLVVVPSYEDDPSFYSDWGDPREYTIGDLGVGECAGEVVTFTEFGLADSEREVFEAQVELDENRPAEAAQLAVKAMLEAAKALVRVQNTDVTDDPNDIVGEFRTRFYDTQLFHDPFAGAKFARYLFQAHANPPNGVDRDAARQYIEEAQLFIEAAHACYDRLSAAG
jgi:sulfite reductase (ferredoxin)